MISFAMAVLAVDDVNTVRRGQIHERITRGSLRSGHFFTRLNLTSDKSTGYLRGSKRSKERFKVQAPTGLSLVDRSLSVDPYSRRKVLGKFCNANLFLVGLNECNHGPHQYGGSEFSQPHAYRMSGPIRGTSCNRGSTVSTISSSPFW